MFLMRFPATLCWLLVWASVLPPFHGLSLGQAAESAILDRAAQERVIDEADALIRHFYFDRGVAEKTAKALLEHERRGDDTGALQGVDFAALLTSQMRKASQDMHLALEYSQSPLPVGPPVQTPADEARFKTEMLRQNCMIRSASVLQGGIGYLKLDFFPEVSVCAERVKAAMKSLNSVRALVFDLRDNMGGAPPTVMLVASYLFDHPEYMYSPRGAPSAEMWTRSPVSGNNLADKPVYILTSGSTWSGAEQFSYDLKMLRRATLIGETTRGGAHAGVFHRIDDHFGIGIPEQRSLNPYGSHDWEGVGVEPDVKVKASDALSVAINMAKTR
jgi:hypothetical protein